MMFLIRTAFWLSVAIMLLPTPSSQPAGEAKVGPAEAMSAASAAVSDMRSFCTRQPEACEVGSQALTQFGYKAQASAKWLYEFISAKMGAERAAPASEPAAAPSVEATPSQHTLTPADLAPAWRTPAPRQVDFRRPG